jgi:hypothetical protein
MTAKSVSFRPGSGLGALLNLIYEVKFSRHVPLTVVLLSGIYAIYRSAHWFMAAFRLPDYIAAPTAVFVELLVLGCGALVFITYRAAYVAELRKEDEQIATLGAKASLVLLAFALAALIGIAWADAWLVTKQHQPAFIMTLVQIGQSGMIGIFVITALLDERAKLREEFAAYRRGVCRWCEQPISANNRARHEASCGQRPQA